jgi:VanZ family protein
VGVVHDRRPGSLGPTLADVAIWSGALVALVATLWLSLGAAPDADDVVGSDKIAHALAYGVDTFLLLLAVVWRPGRPQALVAWMVPIVLGVAALGGLIELAQAAVGRDADPLDWVADLVGVAAATLAFTLLRRRAGSRSEALERGANEPARGA